MWLLLGPRRTLKNVAALAGASRTNGIPPDRDTVAAGYRTFLSRVQPHVPATLATKPEYLVEGPVHARMLAVFNQGSALDDCVYDEIGRETDSAERQRRQKQRVRLNASLDALADRHLGLREIFDTVLTHIVFAPCANAGGGTTSDARGVLWADPRPGWSESDLEEFIVHELTHTLIFLHELCFPLYTAPDQLGDRRWWAISAIRGVPRPLDKAFHSAVVSAELLCFRRVAGVPAGAYILHPPTPELAAGLQRCVQSIQRLDAEFELLTVAARDLVKRCSAVAARDLGAVPAFSAAAH